MIKHGIFIERFFLKKILSQCIEAVKDHLLNIFHAWKKVPFLKRPVFRTPDTNYF